MKAAGMLEMGSLPDFCQKILGYAQKVLVEAPWPRWMQSLLLCAQLDQERIDSSLAAP
jgi:hypothetical protein